MPIELAGLITPDDFYLASAIAGAFSAFIILTIWSRGL